MSCDGFDHGTRVRTLEDLEHLKRLIPQGTEGIVQSVDRSKHQIDVFFEEMGLIKSLPAHSFGPVKAAGLAC